MPPALPPVVELVRLEESRMGTIGVLKINKQAFCVTLEPPDRLNARSVSSIPAQQYDVRRHVSPRHGETFWVQDVPGRDGILFHAGSLVEHTEGCILLGQYFDKFRGQRQIQNTGTTFRRFMETLAGYDEFSLTITENY